MTKIPNSKPVYDLEERIFQNELKKIFSSILEESKEFRSLVFGI